jgi:hypothetical protein
MGSKVLLAMFATSLTACTKTILDGKRIGRALIGRFGAKQLHLSTDCLKRFLVTAFQKRAISTRGSPTEVRRSTDAPIPCLLGV